MADEAYFGALLVLSVVTSHYDGIDLVIVSQGFTTSRSDKDIDALEQEAAPTVRVLAHLVSLEVVL
jgi:hypothetical protein